MENVVITDQIPYIDEALEHLGDEWKVWMNPTEDPLSREEFLSQIEKANGVINVGQQIDVEALDRAKDLRVISQYGAGLDSIDLAAAQTRNILVTNLAEEVTTSTAELAIALMFACARRVTEGNSHVRQQNPFVRSATLLMGRELRGQRLGIVGLGRIGQEVARMGNSLGLDLCYYNRSPKPDFESTHQIERLSLANLMRRSDIVSIHVPGGEETRHLIGEQELSLMPAHAIIINTARGTVIDESALANALKSGVIGGAGLDVYEYEPHVVPDLQELSNTVLMPHVGTSTYQARRKMTMGVVRKMQTALNA